MLKVINPSIRFEWIRKNWSYEDQEHARKVITDKVRVLIICCSTVDTNEKLQFYRDQQDIENPASRSSSLTGSAGGSRPGSRPSSRPRTPAVSTLLLQAASKYRNVRHALDFSAPTASSSRELWAVDEEMNSYIQSPIPSPQTTDMIGYWVVRLNSTHFLSR